MTSFEVKVSWKRNEVWTLPWRKDSFDPTKPFYDMYYSQEPHLRKEWDRNNFPICLQDLAFGRRS